MPEKVRQGHTVIGVMNNQHSIYHMSNRNVWGSCSIMFRLTRLVLVQTFHCLRKCEFEMVFDHCAVKSSAVSCYNIMPDLLTEIMHITAHGQGFEKVATSRAPFFRNDKHDDTCYEAKVSGYSDKPLSPYLYAAHVIR